MDDDDLFDDEKPEEAGAAADEDAEFQNGMVAVYARPRTSMERELDVPCSMRIDDDATNSICVVDPADGQERSWVVDALFNGAAGDKGVGPSHAANQETLWEELGETLLYWAGSGQSVALVAVGERAVGKSHCLFGARGDQAGLVPRFFQACWRRSREDVPPPPVALEISALRIEDDTIIDLLRPTWPLPACGEGLPLRFGRALGPFVGGVSAHTAHNAAEATRLLNQMLDVAAVIEANRPGFSHATHFVLSIKVISTTAGPEETPEVHSNVTFAEIGCPCHGELQPEGVNVDDRLATSAIARANRSVDAMHAVLDALSEPELGADTSHVARLCERSALTYVMADVLGRATRPIWLGCVAPGAPQTAGSLATLRLLERARLVPCRPLVNQGGVLGQGLAERIAAVREEVEQAQAEVAAKAAVEEKAKKLKMATDGVNADRVDDGAAVSYGGSAAAAGLARMRDVEHALKALEATLRERDDATLKHAEERALFMKALGWATMDHAGGNGLTSFDATPMANQMTAALANEPPFITVLLNDALLSGRLRVDLDEGETRVIGSGATLLLAALDNPKCACNLAIGGFDNSVLAAHAELSNPHGSGNTFTIRPTNIVYSPDGISGSPVYLNGEPLVPEGPLPDDGDSSEVSLSKELRHGDCIVLGKRSMLYVVSYGEYIEAWRKGELREIDVGRRPTWFSAMRAMYETGAQPAARVLRGRPELASRRSGPPLWERDVLLERFLQLHQMCLEANGISEELKKASSRRARPRPRSRAN